MRGESRIDSKALKDVQRWIEVAASCSGHFFYTLTSNGQKIFYVQNSSVARGLGELWEILLHKNVCRAAHLTISQTLHAGTAGCTLSGISTQDKTDS
jgi:hypothetical protein